MIKIDIDDINVGTRIILSGIGINFTLDSTETISIDIEGLIGTVLEKRLGHFIHYKILMDENARDVHPKMKTVSLEWMIGELMVSKL